MFKGILIRLRPVTLLVVVLAIALGSVPMAARSARRSRRTSAIRCCRRRQRSTGNGCSQRVPPNHHTTVSKPSRSVTAAQVDQVIINGPPEPPPGTALRAHPRDTFRAQPTGGCRQPSGASL